VLLVGSSDQSTLSVYRFNPASQNLVNHMNFKLQEFEISNKAAYGVNPYPVSKVNGCTKMLLVGEKELLNVRLCDKNLDEISRISYPDQLVRGSLRDFRIGAWGDFSGDGYNDFVISARRADNDSGAAWIVDGRSIQSVGRMTLSKAALLKVSNVDGYFKTGQTKENDGIGSSLSYIAGDLDGDGIVDLSIGAHFNMAYSGSLFVISGADIRNIGSKQAKPEKTAEISTRDKWVTRIVGVLGSELAPPYYHFDNFDINDDGYDDIVISADNDGFSGPNSGSIYILSLNNSMTK